MLLRFPPAPCHTTAGARQLHRETTAAAHHNGARHNDRAGLVGFRVLYLFRMAQPIKDLTELAMKGGAVRAECPCGRVAIFDIRDLCAWLSHKGRTKQWPDFARHLRCGECGRRNPEVTWQPSPPPPEDPLPPRPRFTRAARPPAPLGVPEDVWARARDDRERRRLIRIVRG